MAILATTAAPALAVSTGGALAGASPSGSTKSKKHPLSAPKRSKAPVVPPGASPITARSPSVLYNGPVYQRSVTGAIVPYQPPPPTGQMNGVTGGSPVGVAAAVAPQLLVPGSLARYVNGYAAAPMSAPAAVQAVVWAGNEIIGLPYIYGGGHASFISPGYDCSGTVSFALHGASLLAVPEDSSEFMAWGSQRRRAVDHDLLERRTRLHDRRGAAPGHERGR